MTESGEKFGKKFDRSGHVIEVVAEAEALDKQRKSARVELVIPAGGTFTIDCDEGAYLRGDDTAPPPLSYLTSSIAFWLLTHVSLYAAMLKLEVKSVKARVRGRYYGSGSIQAETVDTGCEGIETELTIESDEDPEKIAKLVRVSEDGCFVIQSLKSPTPVSMSVRLNGDELKVR